MTPDNRQPPTPTPCCRPAHHRQGFPPEPKSTKTSQRDGSMWLSGCQALHTAARRRAKPAPLHPHPSSSTLRRLPCISAAAASLYCYGLTFDDLRALRAQQPSATALESLLSTASSTFRTMQLV